MFICGRVVLINSVLNVLPIFSLSFYVSLVVILKEIVWIQSNFLWGGLSSQRHVHWVSWKLVCRPKDKGGLWIKDIMSFNIALLLK